MKLGLISLGISLVLGIALGILQVLNKEGPLDHLGMIYTIFVNAVPPLVTYSLVLMFGAKVQLHDFLFGEEVVRGERTHQQEHDGGDDQDGHGRL